MILKLKKECEGLRVTRSNITIGKITFDTNSTKEEHYVNYYNLGFEAMFDIIEEEVLEDLESSLEQALEEAIEAIEVKEEEELIEIEVIVPESSIKVEEKVEGEKVTRNRKPSPAKKRTTKRK